MYGDGRLVSSLKSQIYLDNKGKLFYFPGTVYRVLRKKNSIFLLLLLENIFFHRRPDPSESVKAPAVLQPSIPETRERVDFC